MEPPKIIGLLKRMLEGPTIFPKDMTEKKKGKISEYPRVIFNAKDMMIYSYATFNANDEKTTFGYVMIFNGGIVAASTCQGTKFISSKEVEMGVILIALEKAKGKRFRQGACDVGC